MWFERVLLFPTFVCVVLAKSLPDKNNSSVLISEYAKVAHWGSARSSQGQKPWTQRSEGSFSVGQNLQNHRSYDTSRVPAIGEVQDRFNPKPYFVYGTASKQNDPIESPPSKIPSTTNFKSPVYLPTVPPTEVLPIPVLPSTEPKPHEDPYNSPYSSYNPPPKPSEPDEEEDSYNPSQNQVNSSHSDDSYGTDQHVPEDDYLPHDGFPQKDNPPALDHDANSDEYFHQSYFPEDQNQHDHHVKSNGFKEEMDHAPQGFDGEEPPMDPPASEQFPHYLYDNVHSGHHVYHEVEKPKEQKRVSKPQYSYYYIGRKLWYIPLYFSVYFIIYVTFLILKSIARHKIQFKHDLVDLHSRESRQLSDTSGADLDIIHRNVTVALEEGNRKYSLVAM